MYILVIAHHIVFMVYMYTRFFLVIEKIIFLFIVVRLNFHSA